MSKQPYDWKRFWCPRTAQINLGDRGYLVDPDSEYGKFANPDLVSFEAIANIPCLVLLGEPGIGKSQEMKSLVEHTEAKLNLSHAPLELNLRSCSSLATDLVQDPDFIDWMSGEHRLYLFLDSLDEGLLETRNLATQLVDEFSKRKYRDKLNRLYLRIACRTAIFPQVLEEGLKELWKEGLAIYELAPLRCADVETAAKREGLEPQGFLSEIWAKNLVPLAIKPVTLNFILNIYKRHGGQFSSGQSLYNLYLEGCRLLGQEVSPSRHGTSLAGKLDPDERLIVAARIAAITVFANRFAVWTTTNQGDVPAEDVLIGQLILGNEISNGREVEVNQAAIREVLDSGLFSSRGSNRMGWAHQTYAEFLAAWYLVQHQLELPQILTLIIHHNEPDSRITPQLHETVAWLASMVPEVFDKVMETDADMLLRSDIETTTDSVRFALVENLLRLHDEGKLVQDLFHNYRYYKRLANQRLSEQLLPFICDRAKSLDVRYLAIDIAKACERKSLQTELADIALDFSEPFAIRRNAASAICHIGDIFTKERLKPLALFDSGDDPDDEIKGYALRAIYPDNITIHELLSVLTPPKRISFMGAYWRFITSEIVEHLQPTDLLIALEWVEQKPYQELQDLFRKLVDAILFKAWEYLDNPEILQTFARIAIARWCNDKTLFSDGYNPAFEDALLQHDERRHQLLKAIVSKLPSSGQEILWALGSRTGIILQKDILWMLTCIKQAETGQEMQVWISLVRRAFRYPEQMPEEAKAILEASQTNSILHNEFSFWLKTVDLDSAEAVKIWTIYLQEQLWQSDYQDTHLVEPPPNQRVINCLDSFETGNFQKWWDLNLEMTLLPTSQYYDDICRQPDIIDLPGWQDADAFTRSRIVKAAEVFVQQWQSESSGLSLCEIDIAAYKALRLLLAENSDSLLILTRAIWKQFARIIPLAYSYTSGSRYAEYHDALMKVAYRNAPDEVIDTLILLIDRDNTQYGDIHIIDAFRVCWNNKSLSALSEKLVDKALSPESLGNLLKVLLVNGFEQAVEITKSFIPLRLPADIQERSKASFAAIALMLYTRDAGWSVIWQAIQQNPNFGREIFKRISYLVKWDGNLELKLKESCIADLYIFLAKEFPETKLKIEVEANSDSVKDEKFDWGEMNVEDYVIHEEDSINIWKNYIPQRLQERGTSEACKALRRIIHELPELKDKLQWRLLEAEALTRRNTWQPPQPEDILKLVNRQLLDQSQEVPKVTNNYNFDQRGASIGVNVANEGSNIRFIQHAKQSINIPEQDLAEAAQKIQALLAQLAQTDPITTEQQQTFIQKFLERMESTPDLIKVLLAGGIEGLKILCPPAGIPVEVGRRLYEIVQERYKQP